MQRILQDQHFKNTQQTDKNIISVNVGLQLLVITAFQVSEIHTAQVFCWWRDLVYLISRQVCLQNVITFHV